jgi:hypothetical protein
MSALFLVTNVDNKQVHSASTLSFRFRFRLCLTCSCPRLMTASTETAAASLARLFRGSDAILGTDWLDSVEDGLTDTSHHRLVVSNGTLSAAKTRDMYGHYRTKTQMKSKPCRYWKEDPTIGLKEDSKTINDPAMDEKTRLDLLRTGAIGGILLVTRMFDDTGAKTVPFITILAAPALATCDPTSSDQGVLFEDVWDETALTGFDLTIDLTTANCPVLAAQEGFSRSLTVTSRVVSLLLDAQPVLLTQGQSIAQQVTTPDGTVHLRAFLLPEVCDMPIGFRWPITIGLPDFTASITAALGKSSQNFVSVLKALQPQLAPWFKAVADDSPAFLISGRRFLPIYDKHFPDITNGEWPASVTDQDAFSPLLDMLHGFVWRLWCDRQFTTATPLNRTFLASYLALGEPAITATTYLGASIPGRFCPNFAFHFHVDGWPTDQSDGTTQGYLTEFEHLPFVSGRAKQHNRILVNLHEPPTSALLPLQTKEQHSSTASQLRTPRTSKVPPKPLSIHSTPSKLPPVPTHVGTPKGPPPSPLYPQMASGYKKFSPAAYRTPAPPAPTPLLMSTRRVLDLQSATLSPAVSTTVLTSQKFDPLTATVYTAQGRHDATPIFLNCCRLAAHHSPTETLFESDSGLMILPEALIHVREPCRLFRTEIMAPLVGNQNTTTYLPAFQSFMEHLLRQSRVDLTSIYDPCFFSGVLLHSLFAVESWMVSTHLPPSKTPPGTFHVYRLLSSLRAHEKQPLFLPRSGITLAEAKHVGLLAYSLFAMLDLSDVFEDRKFRNSLLGRRLRAWSDLPDNPLVHGIWTQSPKQTSYYWFMSLQSLLLIFQTWIKNLRYHRTRGFVEARDQEKHKHLLLASQTPSPIPDRSDSLVSALQQYDLTFAARWYQLSPYDAIWTAALPPNHFPPLSGSPADTGYPQKRPPPPEEGEADVIKQPRKKLGAARNDFINATPLLVPTIPFNNHTPVSTQLFDRLPKGVLYPKLPSLTGTSQSNICFRSAFAPPHNCCKTSLCRERRQPKPYRLHLDLHLPEWANKPESYWAPLVSFLLDPLVSAVVQPSPAFRRATPSTNWP